MGSLQTKALGVAGNKYFGIATTVTAPFDGTAGASESRGTSNRIVGSPKCIFGIGPNYHPYIGIARGEHLLESPHHHRLFRVAGPLLLGSLDICII